MDKASIERTLDCVRTDRIRRDTYLLLARSYHKANGSIFHVRQFVTTARIASATAVQRLAFLRKIGAI